MSPPYVKIGAARASSFLYRPVLFRFVLFCPVLFCLILLGLVGPCWGQSPQDAPSGQDADSRASLETFSRVYQVVEAHYADPVDPDAAILDGAVRGMLSALDPFSAFFDPEQFRQLQEQQTGKVRGFGSILYVQSGKLVVLQTLEDSPSRRAGLGPGDEIVEINGRRVANLPLPDLVQLLRGARNARVALEVVPSGQILASEFILYPAEISPPSVDSAFLLEPGVAYVRVKNFDIRTPQQLRAKLHDLGSASLKGLVLDLRGNRGGVLEAGVEVASLFLTAGESIVRLRGRTLEEQTFSAPVPNPSYDIPLAVLIDRQTASAAEIVAGALQDHDRAVLVGQPSFGKAAVQSVLPLSDGMGIALTTAEYLTPVGRSIQRPFPTYTSAAKKTPAKIKGEGGIFRSDRGRPLTVKGETGGGIQPDVRAAAPRLDPWTRFLDQSTTFVNFAQHYLQNWDVGGEEFEIPAEGMERFQAFLMGVGIKIPLGSWETNQAYMKMRIKSELFNLTLGLEKGDEVLLRADPVVRKAQELLPKVGEILRAPSP